MKVKKEKGKMKILTGSLDKLSGFKWENPQHKLTSKKIEFPPSHSPMGIKLTTSKIATMFKIFAEEAVLSAYQKKFCTFFWAKREGKASPWRYMPRKMSKTEKESGKLRRGGWECPSVERANSTGVDRAFILFAVSILYSSPFFLPPLYPNKQSGGNVFSGAFVCVFASFFHPLVLFPFF